MGHTGWANPDNLKKGNTVNTGRKKTRVRELCADGFEQAIPALIEQALNVPNGRGKRKYTIPQQQAAADMLARYGIGTKQEVDTEITEYQKILHVSEDDY